MHCLRKAVGCLLLGALATSASAANYTFNWSSPSLVFKQANRSGSFQYTSPGGVSVSDRAGEILKINAEFDDSSNHLSWMVTLGTARMSPPLTRGFTLALTDGEVPIGSDTELALLYFSAAGPSSILTAYAYNGEDNPSSYFDGTSASGVQAPDPIVSSLLSDQIVLEDTLHADGTRTLGFSMDASVINGHVPLHGDPANWRGIGFGESIGISLNTYMLPQVRYADGYLTSVKTSVHGWLKGSQMATVPEPSALALMLGGVATALVCLRRSARANRAARHNS